jgi:hypothetical protein
MINSELSAFYPLTKKEFDKCTEIFQMGCR